MKNNNEIVVNFSKNWKMALDKISKTTKSLILEQNFEDNFKIDTKVINSINYLDSLEKIQILLDINNTDFLKNCTNLRDLIIGNNDNKIPLVIDFETLPKLENLSMTGNFILKNASTARLKNLSVAETKKFKFDFINTLQRIYIRNVNDFCFDNISNQNNLKSLELIQVKCDNILGIEKLVNLEKLSISYCKNMKSFLGIEKCLVLNEIELEKLSNVDILSISKIPNLEKLLLINCGEIPTIKFINNLPKLKFFCFVDTNVLDGDLTPCLKLDFVGTFNKRHYNLKDYQLPGYTKPTV